MSSEPPPYGIDDAAELHQGAVTHELDHAPVVFGSPWFEKFSAKCLERREGARLVSSHEPAVPNDISREDRGQPALIALPHYGSPSRMVSVVVGSLGNAVNRV